MRVVCTAVPTRSLSTAQESSDGAPIGRIVATASRPRRHCPLLPSLQPSPLLEKSRKKYFGSFSLFPSPRLATVGIPPRFPTAPIPYFPRLPDRGIVETSPIVRPVTPASSPPAVATSSPSTPSAAFPSLSAATPSSPSTATTTATVVVAAASASPSHASVFVAPAPAPPAARSVHGKQTPITAPAAAAPAATIIAAAVRVAAAIVPLAARVLGPLVLVAALLVLVAGLLVPMVLLVLLPLVVVVVIVAAVGIAVAAAVALLLLRLLFLGARAQARSWKKERVVHESAAGATKGFRSSLVSSLVTGCSGQTAAVPTKHYRATARTNTAANQPRKPHVGQKEKKVTLRWLFLLSLSIRPRSVIHAGMVAPRPLPPASTPPPWGGC